MAGKVRKIKTMKKVPLSEVQQFSGAMIFKGVWCVIDCRNSKDTYTVNVYQRT